MRCFRFVTPSITAPQKGRGKRLSKRGKIYENTRCCFSKARCWCAARARRGEDLAGVRAVLDLQHRLPSGRRAVLTAARRCCRRRLLRGLLRRDGCCCASPKDSLGGRHGRRVSSCPSRRSRALRQLKKKKNRYEGN